MKEKELTAEELYQKKIADEFERLKNLPPQEIVLTLTEEQKQQELVIMEKRQRIAEINDRLEQLSQDIIQFLAGAEIEDMTERRKEFQTLHNELRVLLGKDPRKYLEVDVAIN